MSVMASSLSPTGRREHVAFAANHAKSNRVLARELGVEESTIRRDRKFLATPVEDRPVKKPKKVRTVRELSPEKRLKRVLKAAQSLITQLTAVLSDVIYILDKTGRFLHRNRPHVEDLPENLGTPFELIALAKPKKPVEDDFTELEYRADWFANWLAMCLPKDKELQDKVLREISLWARQPRRFVSELMSRV
jgi:hypothetical protein